MELARLPYYMSTGGAGDHPMTGGGPRCEAS